MWIYGGILWCFLLLILLNRKILSDNYKYLNPLNLIIMVWGIVITLHKYYYEEQSYTWMIYLLCLVGVISFVIVFWATKNIRLIFGNSRKSSNFRTYSEVGLFKVIKWLTVLEICRTIYCIWVIFSLAGSVSTFIHMGTYVRNLYLTRHTSVIESMLTMLLTLNCMIGLVLVGVYVAKKFYKYKTFCVIWITLEFIMTVITMSKMGFILSLIVFLVAYLNNIGGVKIQKKTIKRIIPFASIAVGSLLIIIGIQRNYKQFGGTLISNIIDNAFFYVTSPLEAIGVYIESNKSEFGFGVNTFKFVFRILTRLGIVSSQNGVLNHEVMINTTMGQTNAYTWYKTFYSDFSYAGFVIGPLIMGFIAGLVYKVKKNNLFNDAVNSWLSGIIVMSFYAYLFGQSTYVLFLLFSYLFDCFFSKYLYVK